MYFINIDTNIVKKRVHEYMYLWSPYTIILFIYHEMHLDS